MPDSVLLQSYMLTSITAGLASLAGLPMSAASQSASEGSAAREVSAQRLVGGVRRSP